MWAVVSTAAMRREKTFEMGIIVCIASRMAKRGSGAVGHPRATVPEPRAPVTTTDTPRAVRSERRRHGLCAAANTPKAVTVMPTSASRGTSDTCTQETLLLTSFFLSYLLNLLI
jgi:hypothetical protein